jgi:hypothetical protein
MSKPKKYTVYSVLGDGNAWVVLVTNSMEEALGKVAAQRERYKSHGRTHAHGVYLTDDPELGDVEAHLEEEMDGDMQWPLELW